MNLSSQSFRHEGAIPPEYAFAKLDPAAHIALSQNRNPELSWSDVPEGSRSFALICVDPDAPTVPDNVNKEGQVVPADLPRADFHHWVMVDISATCTTIAAGECKVCHKWKDNKHDFTLADEGPKLCTGCHEEMIVPKPKEGEEKKLTVHEPITEDCTSCHTPHSADTKALLSMPLLEMCEACHDETFEDPSQSYSQKNQHE